MSKYIPESLRRAVAQRANYCCEYCLTSEVDSVVAFEVDHVFPRKHGGPTSFENLAYTCLICNRNKGSDLATADYPHGPLIRLFNPRAHTWADHFDIDDGMIIGKTDIGMATIKILGMNEVDRIIERRLQIKSGSYPEKNPRN